MNNTKTFRLTLTAVLAAVIAILALFLGSVKIMAIEITVIPIVITLGAVLLGPSGGAALGAVFGVISYMQCYGIVFPLSAFGAAMVQVNPWFTAILCLLPRVLMGWLTGLLFKALHGKDKSGFWSFALAALGCPLLNTVLFTGSFLLLFSHTDFYTTLSAGKSVLAFVGWFVGLNGLIEAAACFVIGTAVSKPLHHYTKRLLGN